MDELQLRGNEKWCEKYGEDLSLPRFFGDEKVLINGKMCYPSYSAPKTFNLRSRNTKTKNTFKTKSKAERKAWWRSLTAEQQADYRCEIMERRGKIPNWDFEYAQAIKEGNYLR